MSSKKEVNTGYITISRQLFEHQFWCEEREFSRFDAWLYLIKEARFEDAKLYIGNCVVNINRGQVYASFRFLAGTFGWSVKRLRGFLELLERENMILREKSSAITGQSIITICNYDKYNSLPKGVKQKKSSEGTAKDTINDLFDNELQDPEAQQRAKTGQSEGTKYNTRINNLESNIPPIPPNAVVAEESTWRESFEIYKNGLRIAYRKCIKDSDFISTQERYHPGVDIALSLEKACVEFWSLEAGWSKKRRSKTENIDWKATFVNALNQKQNLVYQNANKSRQQEPSRPKMEYYEG